MKLSSLLTDELKLSEYQKKALKKLGLVTVRNLLWHFPFRYEEAVEQKAIVDINAGINCVIRGKISNIKLEKTWKKKMALARAVLNDGTGTINVVWFHQPFIANLLKDGDYVVASGKIAKNKNGFYLANPTYEKVSRNIDIGENSQTLTAVYPETRGLSSLWFRFTIKKILKKLLENEKEFIDIVPDEILNSYHLPTLKNAFIYIHTPQNKKDAEAARKRFAFEEIFLIQLSRVQKKLAHEKCDSFNIEVDKKQLKDFLNSFSFKLTDAQKRAIKHITEDLQKDSPMSRFLEGDVGSGKTVVAATSAFLVLKNGYQTAYMAPTEVLAHQLFGSFIDYFASYGAKIGLITSSGCRKFPSKVTPGSSAKISKNRFIKYLKDGEIDIVIGTHSLIQDSIKFSALDKNIYKNKKLALVIIDEQHKFGTNQRAALVNKRNETDKTVVPHFLTMSATPIPRTLALTIFGDLDLTLLDEMPRGRKKIITEIVSPNQRKAAYEKIKEEIKKGRQAFVVCPRINPSTDSGQATADSEKTSLLTLNMKAVKEEYENLSKNVFSEYRLGMLYGKMPAKEKLKVMNDFEKGKIDILISTSVIEVGVNVPNATTIIIEGAERFGLAQLHQLRGRVLRSTYQPYCFVFTESKTARTKERLNALKTAKNGFELAEYDLKFRGAGELSGKKQWGITDVGMEAIKNIKMVEAARSEAQKILTNDPKLKNFPLLREKLSQENLNIHFE